MMIWFLLVLVSDESMTFGSVLGELKAFCETELESSAVIREEFEELRKSFDLDPHTFSDFVKVRLAFETTRDCGLWQVRWVITNEEPNSDQIWKQWGKLKQPEYANEDDAQPTAVAECDELSALFAIVARGLGVKDVGLFWPTSNHTVAVWKAKKTDGSIARIVVPTTQIFLPLDAPLGTQHFDTNRQKNIYNYTRKDVSNVHPIPIELAKMMIEQAKAFGGKSAAELRSRRNRLSYAFGQ